MSSPRNRVNGLDWQASPNNEVTPQSESWVDQIDALLPQTQCQRCGFAACRPYAQAIADEQAPINRCPPGGLEGIQKLARLTGQAVIPLDPACGTEGPVRKAVIDDTRCIGCTLCIAACPVDAIIGAFKLLHQVIEEDCTGCGLCLPPCPVDCIAMVLPEMPIVWNEATAEASRTRFLARQERLLDTNRQKTKDQPSPVARQQAILAAARSRAARRKASLPSAS